MKIYLSHRIAGGDNNVSYTEQEKNCKIARDIAKQIRDALPTIELYVPGDQTEQFVRIALDRGYLTIQQILDVDCKIIDTCDGVLVYCPPDDIIQGGRFVEYKHAIKTNKPVMIFETAEETIPFLTHLIIRA